MEQEFEAKEKKRKAREALGEWADKEEEDEEEYLVSNVYWRKRWEGIMTGGREGGLGLGVRR